MFASSDNTLEDLFKAAEFSRADIFEGSDIKGRNPVMDVYYEYWQRKCRNNQLPRRKDIHPEELREYLPYAALIDILDEPGQDQDFRLIIRLLGTHIVQAFGELTGRDVAELPNPATAKRVYHMSALAMRERLPVMSHVRDYSAEHERMEVLAQYLPLSETGETVDKILAAAEFRVVEQSA